MLEVLPNDNGIRPAGEKDQCFYCGSRVGEIHGPKCVILVKIVEYRVLYEGKVAGTFIREEPYHWDAADCEGHKNQSSWCKGNANEHIQWIIDPPELGECSCGQIEFRFHRTVTEGPIRSES